MICFFRSKEENNNVLSTLKEIRTFIYVYPPSDLSWVNILLNLNEIYLRSDFMSQYQDTKVSIKHQKNNNSTIYFVITRTSEYMPWLYP